MLVSLKNIDMICFECNEISLFPGYNLMHIFFNRLGVEAFFVVEFEFFCNEKWFAAILCNGARESGWFD